MRTTLICFLNINVIVQAELIDKVKQSTGFLCRNSKTSVGLCTIQITAWSSILFTTLCFGQPLKIRAILKGKKQPKQERKLTTELTHWKRPWCWEGLGAGGEGDDKDEMAGWHHRLNGHEFARTPGVGDGQGGLACCDSWGRKESDTTEQLNWTELKDIKKTVTSILMAVPTEKIKNT